MVKQHRHRQGFTIIELLAAIAIIAALVVIAIPAYQSYQNKARAAEATTFLSAAQIAEKSFFQSERSYTLCLPSIMGVDSTQSRYYAIGFNISHSKPYINCGPGQGYDCYQKCFSNLSTCVTTPSPCNQDSSDNGVAYASTAISNGQQINFYTNTDLNAYPSFISTGDFEVVAATNESLFSKNNFLEKIYPSAFAASWKVLAIGPSGGVHQKSVGVLWGCSCFYDGVYSSALATVVTLYVEADVDPASKADCPSGTHVTTCVKP